jgi:hypothetical protein
MTKMKLTNVLLVLYSLLIADTLTNISGAPTYPKTNQERLAGAEFRLFVHANYSTRKECAGTNVCRTIYPPQKSHVRKSTCLI